MKASFRIIAHEMQFDGKPGVQLIAMGVAADKLHDQTFGVATLWETNAEDPWISSVHVAENFRGQGIARALLSECIARAKAANCPRLALWVNPTNARAVAVYSAAGFLIAQKPKAGDMMMVKQLGTFTVGQMNAILGN